MTRPGSWGPGGCPRLDLLRFRRTGTSSTLRTRTPTGGSPCLRTPGASTLPLSGLSPTPNPKEDSGLGTPSTRIGHPPCDRCRRRRDLLPLARVTLGSRPLVSSCRVLPRDRSSSTYPSRDTGPHTDVVPGVSPERHPGRPPTGTPTQESPHSGHLCPVRDFLGSPVTQVSGRALPIHTPTQFRPFSGQVHRQEGRRVDVGDPRTCREGVGTVTEGVSLCLPEDPSPPRTVGVRGSGRPTPVSPTDSRGSLSPSRPPPH